VEGLDNVDTHPPPPKQSQTPSTRLQLSVTDTISGQRVSKDRTVEITVTVAVTNDLYLRYAACAAMLSLESTQQTLLEKAITLLCRTGSFQVRRAKVEELPRTRVGVWRSVGFLTAMMGQLRRNPEEGMIRPTEGCGKT
jgi:hypothetical protein